MLHNTLSAGLHLPTDNIYTALENARIQPSARAQELSLDQWRALYEQLQDMIK